MSMRLTGEQVNVILKGSRDDIEKIMAWFREPVLAENDVTPYRTLNDIRDALPSGYFADDSTNMAVYEINDCLEGYSLEFWKWIIYKAHNISPNVEIDATAHWWQTVTGGRFISEISFVNGELEFDDDEYIINEDEELYEELINGDFEDFEIEVEDGKVWILEYTGADPTVHIPDNVYKIYADAFDDNDAIEAFLVSEDNKNYASADGVLFNKKGTKLIKYPAKKQGAYAIPQNVKQIYNNAFHNCTGLTEVIIHGGLKEIPDGVFLGCENLFNIAVSGENAKLSDIDGVLFSKGKRKLLRFPPGKEADSFVFPKITKTICDSAFDGCKKLVNITIPDRITTSSYTFINCVSLTNITLPNHITTISCEMFKGCTSLKNITIPNNVTSLGHAAFEGCTSLTSITIPNNVTEIDSYVFRGCTSLTSITIPNSVTNIGSSAFEGCTSLMSITIPNHAAKLGYAAFEGCTSLTNITIPNRVKEIGTSTFSGCTSLTSITIPNRVKEIASYAFSGCTSLTSITIPNSVTEIGYSAFGECKNLTINTPEGSFAQKYAMDTGKSFSLIQ